ncbi:hypothetical protein GMORB2_2290 [Geosmithia morbida]|uniref:Uncharacterized protein n=1 Tax=Geosmithia morbida TaxID=1094350 RepID=A0A9P4YQM1_9HYPO|nr:uncharacterized protein GMORB2_2290 [Geosmithia morbida]KAF4121328.1 hypothetical protein GMORB2_2290 [Geosmithia morbida]
MTLTGFGYTLMAKATQGHKSELLGHELRTYRDLTDQQGVRIPVCLGVMRLERPYVESWIDEAGMPRCVALTDMMLMSYVGRDIRSPRIRAGLRQRGNDVEGRAYITQMELWHLGLDSTGYNNLTWCEELGRVMRVDFDHAHVDAVKRCITCRSDRLNHRRPHPITGKLASRLPFAKLGWDDCTWGRSPFAQVRDVRPSDMAIEALFLA